jgi:hypothetical protein
MQQHRNATMGELAEILMDQHKRKHDVVVNAAALESIEGDIVIKAGWTDIDAEGVLVQDLVLTPTAVADEGIADKLGIPIGYLRRMRNERIDLYDANVNGWLNDQGDRQFLVRGFAQSEEGIMRAFLSDTYGIIDHLDVLTAIAGGIARVNVKTEIVQTDLTDRRMYVKMRAPEVKTYARELLKGYRSPFTGESGDDNPTVFAGLVFSNSETGNGAFSLVPQLTVQVCSNGMTITKDAVRKVHLGKRMDEGIIRWSNDTQKKVLELIESQTADAVATYLDEEYMIKVLRDMAEAAERPLPGPIDKTVKVLGKKLAYSEEQIEGIFDHLVRGGQPTSGGLMQAVTSYAQTVKDADEAYRIEESAFRALTVTL